MLLSQKNLSRDRTDSQDCSYGYDSLYYDLRHRGAKALVPMFLAANLIFGGGGYLASNGKKLKRRSFCQRWGLRKGHETVDSRSGWRVVRTVSSVGMRLIRNQAGLTIDRICTSLPIGLCQGGSHVPQRDLTDGTTRGF